MNFDSEIKAQEEKLAELKQKAAKYNAVAATLKAGQCHKFKLTSDKQYYDKILYVDDSGYGYKLIITERLNFGELDIFRNNGGYHFSDRVYLSDRDVGVYIAQEYNYESSLDYATDVTEEEFNQAKQKVLAIIANPQVPSNWEEAVKLRINESCSNVMQNPETPESSPSAQRCACTSGKSDIMRSIAGATGQDSSASNESHESTPEANL